MQDAQDQVPGSQTAPSEPTEAEPPPLPYRFDPSHKDLAVRTIDQAM